MTDLTALFAEYERALLASPTVTRFTILKKRIIEREGFIRARAELKGGGLEGQLIRRWDNASHYPDLPHAPHHIHHGDEMPEGNSQPPTLQTVLTEIEANLSAATE